MSSYVFISYNFTDICIINDQYTVRNVQERAVVIEKREKKIDFSCIVSLETTLLI
jgi:hypothetical protein